jgi:MFS family permease
VSTADAGRVIGLATILAGAASALAVVASGWLSDRIGRRRVFVLFGNGVLETGDILLLVSPTVPIALAIGLAGYPGVFVVSMLGAVGCSVAIALIRSVR